MSNAKDAMSNAKELMSNAKESMSNAKDAMSNAKRPGQAVQIHPGAFVDPGAQLGTGVVIGPGAVVGPFVQVGDRTRIDSHALVTGWTTIGTDNHIHHGAVLGSPPQDLKYSGEPSYLTVGDHNVFREYCTANLATDPGEATRIGNHALFMAYAHVAHNCVIGDRAILANAVQLAGYVVVDTWAIVGGGTVVHQFARIGRHAMVGGGSRISQDIAPFVKCAGSPPRNAGINSIGLARRGAPRAAVEGVERAYRIFFRDGHTVSKAVETIRRELPGLPEVEHFARFCETSVRGITR